MMKTERDYGQYLFGENWVGIDTVAHTLGDKYTPVSDTKLAHDPSEQENLCGRLLRFEDDTGGTLDVSLTYEQGEKGGTLEVTSRYAPGDSAEPDEGYAVTERVTEEFSDPFALYTECAQLMQSTIEDSRRKAGVSGIRAGYNGLKAKIAGAYRSDKSSWD